MFTWGTADPLMGARYRLEWRFRARPDDPDNAAGTPPTLRSSSDRMKAAGIVQAGHPILAAVAGRAREVINALQRVREHHVFHNPASALERQADRALRSRRCPQAAARGTFVQSAGARRRRQWAHDHS
ncbi:hypothetical protein [Streptosporangium sp. NBC_01756]|uniref:hypothetical protein n=1 Tax=Streptosporangium sp. NBC_01756 TaxID=2975950 RepID=UPI002DDAAA9F|nr:hypothetical protein [Streptosporangium sp. NBC_01756]WSC87316.1 hypothetical protein OIE48_03620 [Streptosporangium sp. NBC_01756]